MKTPNLNKFLTAFLILAALASSAAALLSSGINTPAISATPKPEVVDLNGKSVFVEKSAELPSYGKLNLALGPEGYGNPSNLTDYITGQLAEKIVNDNPEGPTTDKKGKPALNLPKDLSGITDVAKFMPSSFSPDYNPKKIKVLQKYTSDDVVAYFNASQGIMRDVLLPGISQMGQQSMSLESLSNLSSLYDSVENKIYANPVPAPLQDFNRTLLGFVTAQKAFIDQTDPAKTLIALQNPDKILSPYMNELKAQSDKLKNDLPKIFAAAEDNQLSPIQKLAGVQRAYAFADWIGGVANIISQIWNYVSSVYQKIASYLSSQEFWRKLFTEYLKDQLVHRLVQQVIMWVQGGGKPQFVTNWQGFLGDEFKKGVSGVITKYAPQLCSSFRPLIQVALTPVNVDYSANSNPYACTLDRVVNNVDDFYKSFQDGGWVAFGTMLNSSNNFYGSYIDLYDESLAQGEAKKDAASKEVSSASGYKSKKDCTDPVYISGNVLELLNASPDDVLSYDESTCDANGYCQKIKVCNPENPNAWQNSTPGTVVASAVNDAVGGSPIQRIVNANDFTALISALVNSALNKLIGSAQKGLADLTAKDLTSQGSLASTCNGLTGQDLATCQAQNGNIASTTNSSSGSSQAAIIEQLKKVLKFNQDILQDAQKSVSMSNQALSYLNAASSTCSSGLASSTADDALNTLSWIDQGIQKINDRVPQIQEIVKDLAGDPGATDQDKKDGKLKRLADIISMVDDNKIQDLAALLDITLLTSGEAQQIREDFYQKFASDLDNPGSKFGKTFGTIETASNDLSDLRQYETEISVPEACGILEKAKLLINSDNFCSISKAEKTCRKGDY